MKRVVRSSLTDSSQYTLAKIKDHIDNLITCIETTNFYRHGEAFDVLGNDLIEELYKAYEKIQDYEEQVMS